MVFYHRKDNIYADTQFYFRKQTAIVLFSELKYIMLEIENGFNSKECISYASRN